MLVQNPSALFYDALGTYDDTINLIRTPEMGARVAQALGDRRAVLLKNHGVVVAGPSIEEVVISAIMLENAARIQMIVQAAGNSGPEFPARDIAQLQHDIGRSRTVCDQLRLSRSPRAEKTTLASRRLSAPDW